MTKLWHNCITDYVNQKNKPWHNYGIKMDPNILPNFQSQEVLHQELEGFVLQVSLLKVTGSFLCCMFRSIGNIPFPWENVLPRYLPP